MSKITHAPVRMYKMGTGDCFVLKFFSGETEKYKMMIDCGTWYGSKEEIKKYLDVIHKDVDGHFNILVVTHEHKDHVHGFDVCREMILNDFSFDQIWMGWTEDESSAKVKKWQKEFGDKKKSLAIASQELKKAVKNDDYQATTKNEFTGGQILELRENFSFAIDQLNELHNTLNDDGNYIGGLAGMRVIKDQLAKKNIRYFSPGDIVDLSPDLEGIKFYILGPPKIYSGVTDVQEGGKGESYDHNKELSVDDAFSAALISQNENDFTKGPFAADYSDTDPESLTNILYNKENEAYRKIDTEWLNNAGSLALRINSITNNLSLAFAVEFEDSGKVMLFPGDAEFGSWASWHTINWDVPARTEKKHLTEDLLNRTVFYKVAHHLSHHGTAKRLGLEMMTSPELAAMATLDYSIISPQWKKTMPNKAIIKELITRTKGRLMVMNEKDLTVDLDNTIPLTEKLEEVRKQMSKKDQEKFSENFDEQELFIEYRIDGQI